MITVTQIRQAWRHSGGWHGVDWHWVAAGLFIAMLMFLFTIRDMDRVSAQQAFQGETPSRCLSEGVTSVKIDTATSGNVELVALTASQRVFVCGFGFESDTATTSVQFVYGTGTACGDGETDLTGPMTILASTPTVAANAGNVQFKTAAGNALCIELGAATQVNGWVTYYKAVPR